MTNGFLRVAQGQLILGAAILLALGRWLAAGHWSVTATAALIARPAPRWKLPNALFLSVLTAQAWATLLLPSLARSNTWWDVAHLTVSAAATPVVYRAILENARPEPAVSRLAAVLTAAALTITGGVVWELLEWRIDAVLHLHLARGYIDTMHDLLADTTGALIGGIYLTHHIRQPG